MRLHRRWGYPLWWVLFVCAWEWALPLRIRIRPWLTDGSGRHGYVTCVELSLFCLHWDIHYAWGRRRYYPPPERVLSLREVLEYDRSHPLENGRNQPEGIDHGVAGTLETDGQRASST
jgi:hypothetical protein